MRALVTGGTKGIGSAIVRELEDNLIQCLTFSRSTGVDVCNEGALAHWCSKSEPVDILINNVGGGGRYGTDAEVMQKNVGAMMFLTNWALPHMLENKWGRVITIGSIHAREYGSRPIFMSAKSAQVAWMKGMSKEKKYVRNGITFNTVCPGNVQVDGKPKVDEEVLPMGRMGRPEEVAKLVSFLCSHDASWINGSAIVIDGGESCAL